MRGDIVKQLRDQLSSRGAPGYVLDALDKWKAETGSGPGEATRTEDTVSMEMIPVKEENKNVK